MREFRRRLDRDLRPLTNQFVVRVFERSVLDKTFRAQVRIAINEIPTTIEIFRGTGDKKLIEIAR
jgi:hypothetical protein